MNDTPPEKDEDVLKTFDMYHFFSRTDVIAAIVFIIVLLAYALFKYFYMPVVA